MPVFPEWSSLGRRVANQQGRPKSHTKAQKKPPTYAELMRQNERLQVRLDIVTRAQFAGGATAVIRDGIKWGVIGLTAWKCVEELAGKTTLVDAAIDVGSTSVSQALGELIPSWSVLIAATLVAVLAVLSNVRLRRLNAGLNRRLGEFVPKHESQFDPLRLSSGLGADGHTHWRDE